MPQGEGWDDEEVSFPPATGKQEISEVKLGVEGHPKLAQIAKDVNEVNSELRLVHQGRYDERRAVRTAALALSVQLDIADVLPTLEGTAKGVKLDAKVVESNQYLDYKSAARTSEDKKPTDVALQRLVAKDSKLLAAERRAIDAEKESKTWAHILVAMKDAHIFFRNLGKE